MIKLFKRYIFFYLLIMSLLNLCYIRIKNHNWEIMSLSSVFPFPVGIQTFSVAKNCSIL